MEPSFCRQYVRAAVVAVVLVTAALLMAAAVPVGTHVPRFIPGLGPSVTSTSAGRLEVHPSLESASEDDDTPTQGAGALVNRRLTYPGHAIPPGAYAAGVRAAESLPEQQSSTTWRELGPDYLPEANWPNPRSGVATGVSGRVTALAIDPTTCGPRVCTTIYAGTLGGGLWKTMDAGQSWTPLTDNRPGPAIGALALDPENRNIVYAGTGDPNWSNNSHYGVGILRSTDAGSTWTLLGEKQFGDRAIADIIVEPRTAGNTSATLYVASTRPTARELGDAAFCSTHPPGFPLPACGFYVSHDGGQTWMVSNPHHVIDGAQSLVMDPSNPKVLYAGFSYFGVYRSADDGLSWERLSRGLPSAQANFDRVTVAVAPSDPRVVYASYDLNGAQALFRSSNAGASWTRLKHAPDACDGQCWGDMPLAVDPVDANAVFAGGTANYDYLDIGSAGSNTHCYDLHVLAHPCHATLMKSVDGGKTWSDVSENGTRGPLHPDDRAIVIDPNNPNIIYVGTDGGVFHSADGGMHWDGVNRGLGTQVFWTLAAGSDGTVLGGTQDNGTLRYDRGHWTHILGGDGGYTAVDPTNSRRLYVSHSGSTLYRSDAAGADGSYVLIDPFWGDYTLKGGGLFYEPFVLAPSRPRTIFYGTYRIWRSEDAGGVDGNYDGSAFDDRSDTTDWRPISFDLSCPRQPPKPRYMCVRSGDGISSIGVSALNANVLAAGTSNGHVWLTQTALAAVTTDHVCDPRTNSRHTEKCNFERGVRWARIDRALPNRYVTAIAFAPGSSRTIYVTYSGFNENTPHRPGHIFMSSDAGATWRDLDGSQPARALPDLPMNDVVVNPDNGHLYVAADYGVFVSTDGGSSWNRVGDNLPSSPVYQIQLDRRDRTLVAATHGRGVWAIPAP